MTASTAPPRTTPEAVLSASPMPELRQLEVYADEDEVVLVGRVSSYYLKQLAQECVRGTVHGRTLRNRVEVRR
jgi:hypothetical protein